MSKKFRLGIVGCGDISRYIALGVKMNPRIAISSCADVSEEARCGYARKHRVPCSFDDYRKMFDSGGMDAVYLAVPHHLHHPMIAAAVERGLPVLCEKPVATTLEDAMDICAISRKRGVKVGINYQYRYDNAGYALARAAQKGDLGEIMYGRCNLPWFRDEDYFDLGQWRIRLATAGGGTLITQASHLLDLLLWAMKGRSPVAAVGMKARRKFRDVEVEDLCAGSIEMDDGALISLTSSMVSVPEQPVSVEVYGSRGTGIYTGPERPKVRFAGVKVRKEKPGIFAFHALFRCLEAFRRWVRDDGPFLNSVEQSLPVLASVLAVYKSADSGKREPVDRRYLKFMV